MRDNREERAMTAGKIERGETALGIEFGSTRIKAILVDLNGTVLARGDHTWENSLEDGIWTYDLAAAVEGLQACYADLKADVERTYAVVPTTFGALGISGMMHGYLAFDETGELLVPFRTWRNTMTADEAAELSALFAFNIPQRWSVAHFARAIRAGEAHVGRVRRLTTLAGYMHGRLGGSFVLGCGDASGMFPLEDGKAAYRKDLLERFDRAFLNGSGTKLEQLLPRPLAAGSDAGRLDEAGARLLDPAGDLKAGILLAPPEGGAVTGMVATESIAPRTGNLSAGTSIFAMIVLEHELSRYDPGVDIVATPDGRPVAMVHCNNGLGDIDAHIRFLSDLLGQCGSSVSTDRLYETFYRAAAAAESDAGGLVNISYLSGEHLADLESGLPLLLRRPESRLTLANLARSLLFSTLATLRIGLDRLRSREAVPVDVLSGHGGLFKLGELTAPLVAGALGTSIRLAGEAGEGGAWGMALLSAYAVSRGDKESLDAFLTRTAFGNGNGAIYAPDAETIQGFERYLDTYRRALAVERAAVEADLFS